MKAHSMYTDDDRKTVWLTYAEPGKKAVHRSAFLITTDNAHADRIVRAVNAPAPGSFPALLAASAARAEQERKDWL